MIRLHQHVVASKVKILSSLCNQLSTYKPFKERLCDYDFIAEEDLDHVEHPMENRKLHTILRKPNFAGNARILAYAKQNRDIVGPELVHNKLNFNQYGIQSLEGGNLKFGHMDMLRLSINRKMDLNRMFARWRVDSPWKPVTKRALNSRMGGGKPDVSYFVTPVKEGRIIVELCGNLRWQEAYSILHNLARKMPFPARFVSQKLLDFENNVEEHIRKENVNPMAFRVQHLMNKNYAGCHQFLSPWNLDWGTAKLKK